MNKECLTCSQIFYVSPSRDHIKNCSYICNKVWRKAEAERIRNTLIVCMCGCGTKIPIMDKYTHRRKYVFGHQPIAKVNSGRFKKGHIVSRGESNGNWRGGVSLMRNGYIQVWLQGKRKYLHRLIMEQELGRELKITEQVHHIDHDKLNNSPDNLVVLTPRQHAKYHSDVMWGNLTKGQYHGV